MGKPIKVHVSEGYQLRHTGVFNIKKLYKEMRSFIESKGYQFFEKKQEHKTYDKGDEIIWSWEAEKWVTEFVSFKLNVDAVFIETIPVSESEDLVSARA